MRCTSGKRAPASWRRSRTRASAASPTASWGRFGTRIGPTFSAAELADLYGQGTDWALQVAGDVAPPIEGRAQALADAAFWAYLRGATDFAGGRQLVP